MELPVLILEELRWRRADQIGRVEALNRRINTMFTLNFAVLAVLGATLPFGSVTVPVFIEYLSYATIFVLVFNTAVLIGAFVLGQWRHQPTLEEINSFALSEKDPTYIEGFFTGRIHLALVANERRISHKGRLASVAIAGSFLAVLLIALITALTLQFAQPPGT